MYIYGGYQDLKGSTSELWAFHFGKYLLRNDLENIFAKKTFRRIHCLVKLENNFSLKKLSNLFLK
jgi:uncharacterized membrane protein YdjX (TVP38/TMEM64 family)